MLRLNISPVATILQKEFKISSLELGFALSAVLWVYTFLQPVAGWAADRWGAKLTMLTGLLASSIITILTGFVTSLVALIVLRIVLGITQAPNFVSGAKVSSSGWYDQERRARGTSIWIAGGRLGTVFTFPVAAALAVTFGWQWAFFGTGLLGLVWCGLWLYGYRDRNQLAPQPDRKPDRRLAVGRSGVYKVLFLVAVLVLLVAVYPFIVQGLSIFTVSLLILGAGLLLVALVASYSVAGPVLVSPLGLGLTLASFGQGYIAYYLSLWLPTYLVREQKFTVLGAGLFSDLPFIAAVVTILLAGGVLSDFMVRKGASPVGLRSRLFSVGMVGVAVMLFATAYAPDPYLALVSLTLAGAAWGLSTPSLWAALVEATPREFAGSMGGLQNFGGNFGGIVVSILTGYILASTGRFYFAMVSASLAALLAALSAFFFVRPKVQTRSLLI